MSYLKNIDWEYLCNLVHKVSKEENTIKGMRFSSLVPSNKDIACSELDSRLPIQLALFNVRAAISRCAHWEGNVGIFKIEDPKRKVLTVPSFKCSKFTNSSEFSKFSNKRPPCNGALSSCPYYTGICWEFCSDEQVTDNQPIKAEQILELRYYIRGTSWNLADYNSFFEDSGDIYVWLHSRGKFDYQKTNQAGEPINGVTITEYPAVRVFQTDFSKFNVRYETCRLTEGTGTDGTIRNFPTLIKEIGEYFLLNPPVFKNKFDLSTEDEFIFETPIIEYPIKITLFGETSYVDSDVIIADITDFKFKRFLPTEVLDNPDLFTIYNKYLVAYEDSKLRFKNFNDLLSLRLYNLSLYLPDIFIKFRSTNTSTFFKRVPTVLGKREFIVFECHNGYCNFNKITVNVGCCASIPTQLFFDVEGDSRSLPGVPYFDKGFLGNNDSNKISTSLVLKKISDFSKPNIFNIFNSNDKTEQGNADYGKYEVDIVFELDESMIQFFGVAGHALVSLPDEDKVITRIPDDLQFPKGIILDVHNSDCIMDESNPYIVMKYNPLAYYELEPHQFIIKPASLNTFRRPNKFTCSLTVRYTEYKSFGEESSGNLVKGNLTPTEEFGYLDFTEESDAVTISNFRDSTLLINVLYTGSNGRCKGIGITKLLVWVRYPKCQDVEILYEWDALYTQNTVLSAMQCNLSLVGLSYGTVDKDFTAYNLRGFWDEDGIHAIKHSTPDCGDHDLNSEFRHAPMWYPYNACGSAARYRFFDPAFSYGLVNTMETFINEDGSVNEEHGNFDMRMLGPEDAFYKSKYHPTIWTCWCEYTFYNFHKDGDNRFSGWAAYRGYGDGSNPKAYESFLNTSLGSYSSNGFAVTRDIFTEGYPPRFGNIDRSRLDSYRSTDRSKYTYTKIIGQQEIIITDWRWMELPATYSPEDPLELPIEYWQNLDVSDKYPYTHQLGLFKVNQLEGCNILEQLDSTRYYLQELVETYEYLDLSYPTLAKQYTTYNNEGEEAPIFTGYQYKLIDGKETQWIWRDKWLDIERYYQSTNNVESTIIDSLIEEGDRSQGYNKPYDSKTGVGFLKNVVFSYPQYILEYTLKEHTLVCDEGEHIITIERGISDSNLEACSYYRIDLDNGLSRVFKIGESFLKDLPSSVSFATSTTLESDLLMYNLCDASNLFKTSKITLFTPNITASNTLQDAIEQAKNLEYVIAAPPIGEEECYYFKGINVDISNFEGISYKELFNYSYFEFITNTNLTALGVQVGDSLPFDRIFNIPLSYNTSFQSKPNSGKIRLFSINLGFKEGLSIVKENDSLLVTLWIIPDILIKANSGNNTYEVKSILQKRESITSEAYFEYEKVKKVTISLDLDYFIYNFTLDYSIESNIKSNNTFLEKWLIINGFEYYVDNNKYKVNYSYCFTSFNVIADDGTSRIVKETIKTFERKYTRSYTVTSDLPVFGDNGTLMAPLSKERSTIRQLPYHAGIIGANNSSRSLKSINKFRGTIYQPLKYKDGERLNSTDIYWLESIQKKLYTDALESGNTRFNMESVLTERYKNLLEGLNLRIETTTVKFSNTYVPKLSEVIPRESYSPAGFYIGHNPDTIEYVRCTTRVHDYIISRSVFSGASDNVTVNSETGEVMNADESWAISFQRGLANITAFEYDMLFVNPILEEILPVEGSLGFTYNIEFLTERVYYFDWPLSSSVQHSVSTSSFDNFDPVPDDSFPLSLNWLCRLNNTEDC